MHLATSAVISKYSLQHSVLIQPQPLFSLHVTRQILQQTSDSPHKLLITLHYLLASRDLQCLAVIPLRPLQTLHSY